MLREVIIGISPLAQTPSAYSFRRYKQVSSANNAAREASARSQHRAKDYTDADAEHKRFQVGDRLSIPIPNLSKSARILKTKCSEIQLINKLLVVVATFREPTTQSQSTVHVDRSLPLSEGLDVPDLVHLSLSVSVPSLPVSVQEDPTRRVAAGDPAMQPRAIGQIEPNWTRHDDYIFLIYTCSAMEQVVANQSRFLTRAPI